MSSRTKLALMMALFALPTLALLPVKLAALALIADSGHMVTDAAAVLANFEMMTRVADGTGARFPAATSVQRAALDERLDIASFTSAR